ncbi:MAG: hypothetical protein PHG87_01500 [Candidatus Omnitrophica bacterium]|nr:hypothetical protein [Candidatus Omnitrophota bacterium]
MSIPAGFELEEQAAVTPEASGVETATASLPSGFVQEDKVIPEIRQAPQSGMFDKMINFFKDPERDVAKAQNIYALSDVTGLPLSEVNKNYEVLRRSVKVTGITPDLDRKEFMGMAMLPAVAAGAVTNPIGTAAGLIAFGALDKAIPTDKLINNLKEQGISDEVTTTIELADFIGKAMIVGGVFNKAPKLAEGFLRHKITGYKMPNTINLSAEQVRDIYQTGRLTTPEQQSLFGSLGLNSYDTRGALEHGININMPAEKIVTLTDKPYWAKVKGIFGAEPAVETRVDIAGKPIQAPAGLIEGKVETPIPAIKPPDLSTEQSKIDFMAQKINEHKALSTEEIYNRAEVLSRNMENWTEEQGLEAEVLNRELNRREAKEPIKISDEEVDELTDKLSAKLDVTLTEDQKNNLEDLSREMLAQDKVSGEKVDKRYKEAALKAIKEKNIITGKPPIEPPKVIEGQPQQPSGDPVQKVISVLKEAKSVRGTQETLYAKARAQKFAKMLAVGKKVRGEKGYYAQLGALKGELPKAEFEAIRNKLTQEDIDILFNMVKDSPKIGEWDKLSAREGLGKLFGEYGGKVPTENEVSLLNKVFGEEFTKAILEKKPLFEKVKYVLNQTINIPKSIMASYDLSAPFRQGIFLIGKPKQFWGSFKRMFGAFKSEVAFNAIQDTIIKDPDFQLARDSKLSLTDMDVLLGEREEAFLSSWAEKIPLVGIGIKASNRAYVGFLNKLRFDVFKDLVDKAELSGLKARENRDLSMAIADFVNNATGRGTLPGGLQKASVTLNSFFFSPRLVMSRINLLNPVYYIKQDPFVRKEALKSLLAFLGFGVTVLTLAKMAGSEVGTDPKSSDFGKVKIGNTRIDVWGGFQQLSVMASRIITGKIVSSTTGKEMTLGEGYKPMTRADIIQHFIESKESPVASFITSLLKGQDATGQKIDIPKEIGQRFVPMVIQDMYDILQEAPGLLPVSLLGIFGVGIQTYKQGTYR